MSGNKPTSSHHLQLLINGLYQWGSQLICYIWGRLYVAQFAKLKCRASLTCQHLSMELGWTAPLYSPTGSPGTKPSSQWQHSTNLLFAQIWWRLGIREFWVRSICVCSEVSMLAQNEQCEELCKWLTGLPLLFTAVRRGGLKGSTKKDTAKNQDS